MTRTPGGPMAIMSISSAWNWCVTDQVRLVSSIHWSSLAPSTDSMRLLRCSNAVRSLSLANGPQWNGVTFMSRFRVKTNRGKAYIVLCVSESGLVVSAPLAAQLPTADRRVQGLDLLWNSDFLYDLLGNDEGRSRRERPFLSRRQWFWEPSFVPSAGNIHAVIHISSSHINSWTPGIPAERPPPAPVRRFRFL